MQRLVIHSVDFIWLSTFKQSVLKLMLNEFGTQTHYYKSLSTKTAVCKDLLLKQLRSNGLVLKLLCSNDIALVLFIWLST